MSLPLNGFHRGDETQPPSYSPEPADSPVEEWPDWSGSDVDENRDRQSVQIHIQTSDQAQPPSSGLAQLSHVDVGEEPWDDFEDAEPTSDVSPAPHITDRVLLTPPIGGATTPVEQATGTLRSTESKPLKLTSSSSPQPTDGKSAAPLADGWAQEEKAAEKSSKPTNSKPKTAMPQWNGGTEGLGEEFTIKVKKKVEQDPELDLFADMVPDIKLSSPALLPTNESGALEEHASTASSEVAKRLQVDTSVDTATLTAKFAAADLPEVSVWCWFAACCSSQCTKPQFSKKTSSI